MASGIVQNKKEFLNAAKKFIRQHRLQMRAKIRVIAEYIHDETVKRTPMNTGKTIANYQWSLGSPALNVIEYGKKPTVSTNKLAVGDEPRRKMTETFAKASFKKVDWKKAYGNVVYFTNNNPTWGGLERGQLPKSPYVPRSPQGMFGLAMQGVQARLGSGAFKVTV